MSRNAVGSDQPKGGEWDAVMTRCAPLLPVFADLRSNVRAEEAVRLLKLPDEKALTRWLVLHRLPPFRRLRVWICVVLLVERFDDVSTLSNWAMKRGQRPSVYYHFVWRETARAWGDLKKPGPEWVRRHALNAWSSFLT